MIWGRRSGACWIIGNVHDLAISGSRELGGLSQVASENCGPRKKAVKQLIYYP